MKISRETLKYSVRTLTLAHSVPVGLVHITQLALKVKVDDEVEVTSVPRVRLHAERAAYLFALLHRHVVLEVEHGLLPVGVGSFGGCAEADALVALRELHVEERDERLDIVVATHLGNLYLVTPHRI